jgi:hypothetical protein
MKYKLETYQKNFPNFICCSLTSTKVSSHNEETKVGPNGTIQKEEVQTKKLKDLKSGAVKEEEV